MLSMSRSLSAKPVVLERYEIEALIEWHRDQQYHASDKEEYADAAVHKHRVEELRQELAPASVEPATTTGEKT